MRRLLRPRHASCRKSSDDSSDVPSFRSGRSFSEPHAARLVVASILAVTGINVPSMNGYLAHIPSPSWRPDGAAFDQLPRTRDQVQSVCGRTTSKLTSTVPLHFVCCQLSPAGIRDYFRLRLRPCCLTAKMANSWLGPYINIPLAARPSLVGGEGKASLFRIVAWQKRAQRHAFRSVSGEHPISRCQNGGRHRRPPNRGSGLPV